MHETVRHGSSPSVNAPRAHERCTTVRRERDRLTHVLTSPDLATIPRTLATADAHITPRGPVVCVTMGECRTLRSLSPAGPPAPLPRT